MERPAQLSELGRAQDHGDACRCAEIIGAVHAADGIRTAGGDDGIGELDERADPPGIRARDDYALCVCETQAVVDALLICEDDILRGPLFQIHTRTSPGKYTNVQYALQ